MGILSVIARLIQFTGSVVFKLLILPYQIMAKAFGQFVAFFLYLPVLVVLFGVFIQLFEQEVVNKSPWKSMTYFHTLPHAERQNLVDMAELASFVYLGPEVWGKQFHSLQDKGFYLYEKPSINDEGLTYAVLGKTHYSHHAPNAGEQEVSTKDIYIVFRGSETAADWIDDSQMVLSDEHLQHMGRFIVALGVVKHIMSLVPQETNIILVGHSLGGATVQYILQNISSTRLRGFTINPIGLPGKVGITRDNRLTDIVHEADIAQTIMLDSRRVGRGILVRGKFSRQKDGTWTPDFSLLSAAGQHSIDNTLSNMLSQHTGQYVPPADSQIAKPEPGGLNAPVKKNFQREWNDSIL